MISVVIPLYNKEAGIGQAIDSVLSQRFTDFELLVINDGSTDGSLSVVEHYDDERITVVTTQNRGVSAARNTGAAMAKHQWIAFLDADDWWAPEFLSEISSAIYNYPEKQWLATGRTHVYKNREWRYTHEFLPNEGEIGVVNYFSIIAKYLPAIHSSSAVLRKKFVLDAGGFCEQMKQYEDHELWLRLAVLEPLVFVNKPLSFYNKKSDQGASLKSLQFEDLLRYTRTFKTVYAALPTDDRYAFKKFCNRFLVPTFIKYKKTYTSKQIDTLYDSIKPMLTVSNRYMLKVIHIFPYVNLYNILKPFHRGN